MARKPPPGAALHDSPDEVEALFYEALQQGDITKLMATWADDDDIACVHPGGARLVGAAAIREAFEAIFAHAPVPLRLEQVRRFSALGCAVHHVVESIPVEGPQGLQKAWVLSTNVFVKTAQGWRMAAHHASPANPEDLPSAGDAPSTLH
jgi:uncharacterized protein (TIGR02246 family)